MKTQEDLLYLKYLDTEIKDGLVIKDLYKVCTKDALQIAAGIEQPDFYKVWKLYKGSSRYYSSLLYNSKISLSLPSGQFATALVILGRLCYLTDCMRYVNFIPMDYKRRNLTEVLVIDNILNVILDVNPTTDDYVKADKENITRYKLQKSKKKVNSVVEWKKYTLGQISDYAETDLDV